MPKSNGILACLIALRPESERTGDLGAPENGRLE